MQSIDRAMGISETIEIQAPAKINLGLRVLRKRSDGFHDIATVFLAIEWYDRLSISASDSISMTCSDPAIPTDNRNLSVAAAEMMAEKFRVGDGVAIHLEKHLPSGAGLGGGSSDAASTLLALRTLWQLSSPIGELNELALNLGSDVPFFLDPRPALGQGRGDHLVYLTDTTQTQQLSFPYTVAVAVPPIHSSTATAYKNVFPQEADPYELRDLIVNGSVEAWRSNLVNDFESPIFALYPEISELKNRFYEAGAVYASMTGTGSAVYGLFEDEPRAIQAVDDCLFPSWVGRPLV